MFQVRIHGRGGQGVVTASELLALAGFVEGMHAQAFPSFGSERTGAPVASFVRLSDDPIRAHEPVVAPDAVIIQDVTLMRQVDVLAGLRSDGYVVVNSTRSVAELAICPDLDRQYPGHVVTVPASEIALRHLGRPLPSGAMLGAFAAVTRCRHHPVARRCDRRTAARTGRLAERCRGDRELRVRPAARADSRRPPCDGRLRGRELSPRRWPAAGHR